eukprot:350406-Chlamydomonas_euryale.AAC.1
MEGRSRNKSSGKNALMSIDDKPPSGASPGGSGMGMGPHASSESGCGWPGPGVTTGSRQPGWSCGCWGGGGWGATGSTGQGELLAAAPGGPTSMTWSGTTAHPGCPGWCHAASALSRSSCSCAAKASGTSCTRSWPLSNCANADGLSKQIWPRAALNTRPAARSSSACHTRQRESSNTMRLSTCCRCSHLCSCLPRMPKTSCSCNDR